MADAYAGYAHRRRDSIRHMLADMNHSLAICGVYIPIGRHRYRGTIPKRECTQCRALLNRRQSLPNAPVIGS